MWASNESDQPIPTTDDLYTCPRCAFNRSVFVVGHRLASLDSQWSVHLGNAFRSASSKVGRPLQLLGHISFSTRDFTTCDESDWVPSQLAMRINIVIDEGASFFSVTVLDVPHSVSRISLLTSADSHNLMANTTDGSYDLLVWQEATDSPQQSSLSFAELRDLLSAFKLQLVIAMREDDAEEFSSDLISVLEQHNAIERNADYELPCGLHSDTYINLPAICSREDSMQLIGSKLDFLFWDKHFDTVFANGWAMSLLGRRLGDNRQAQGGKVIQHVLCEGYTDPVLLDDIESGSQVLIILDVMITGTLASRLRRIVENSGAHVVGIAVLVRPHSAAWDVSPDVRYLCEVEMNLNDPIKSCPRCGAFERKVFNPVAGYMTTKASKARSPSQFLDQDREARELWNLVNEVDAYEHHRREGATHYIGFVDTRKLLEAPVGRQLCQRLLDILSDAGETPTVFLVPRRSRASLLAKKLSEAMEDVLKPRPRVIYAARRWRTGRWVVADEDVAALRNNKVLIVDTAVGHGRTIDQLATVAMQCKARSIGAAVLLSRLSPPCEETFRNRFDGRFYRLFNLPIRPVAIRGGRVDLCPVCRRKEALRRFVEEADVSSLDGWVESLLKTRHGAPQDAPHSQQVQLSLFDRGLLVGCRAAIASGIALHALSAATTNGIAPLTLPELLDNSIPWRARATMVENLPPGILAWSGSTLMADLTAVLSQADCPAVWRAAANLLTREGDNSWLDHLEPLLNRLHAEKRRTSPSFWNHMTCNAYLLSANDDHYRSILRDRIQELLTAQSDAVARDGLLQMQEVLSE